MSSKLLADLDSFYQQQPDTNNSKAYKNEDDWGDFQGSRELVDENPLSAAGKLFFDDQGSKGEPSGTNSLFDAVDELGRGISARSIISDSKLSLTPKKAGMVTKYKRTGSTKEQKNDLSLLDKGGSKPTKSLVNDTEAVLNRSSVLKAEKSLENADEWADFTLTPVVQKASKDNNLTNSTDIPLQCRYGIHEQEVPPTNVPPPALILALFVQVISESKNELLQLTKPCKEQNSHENSVEDADFLRAYMETGRVLARVIAGRKLRWKRDHILSQGMKIGPASVKRVSGMKLVGVDKAEMGREEKEVLDIVEIWREQLGWLRSIVAAFAKSGFDKIGAIPDIQLNIPVKVLKETEGGLSSTHSCAICGLKRNERVHRVDLNVHDSFGEWWVESMNMHRTCKYFWQSHKSKLQSS